MQQKKVLVLNGTSEVGKAYCRELVQSGYIPVALSNNLEAGYQLVETDPQIRFIESRLENPDDYEILLSQLPSFIRPIDHIIVLHDHTTFIDKADSPAQWQYSTQKILTQPATLLASLHHFTEVQSCTLVINRNQNVSAVQSSLLHALVHYAQKTALHPDTQCRINCVEYDVSTIPDSDAINMCLHTMQGSESMRGKHFNL